MGHAPPRYAPAYDTRFNWRTLRRERVRRVERQWSNRRQRHVEAPGRPPGEGWAWSDERGWHDGLDRLADRFLRDELDLIDYLLAVAAYPERVEPAGDPYGGRIPEGTVRVNEYGETAAFDGRLWQRVGAEHPAWRDPRAARLHNEDIDTEQRRHLREHEERRAWHAASERAKQRKAWARTERDVAILAENAARPHTGRTLSGLVAQLAALEDKVAITHAEVEVAGRIVDNVARGA